MTHKLDTPLTRLQARLDASEKENAELKVNMAKVRGVNDLLKFELAALERQVLGAQKNLDEVYEHVKKLQAGLPELGPSS
jgi:predicted  nucleic acid-binding Zn-ribbon protein